MVDTSQRSVLVLAIASSAAFMASLDVFIVNVAFDAIGADFHGATLAQLSWVLSAYAIVYAALLVPAGRIADRYGRKGGFIVGLAVFTLASAGCAFKNPPQDSAGRLVDAAGLKGARSGGAEISPVHANFIVNLGAPGLPGATAADVRALVERAETAVFDRFGVRLEREMVIWPEPLRPLSP